MTNERTKVLTSRELFATNEWRALADLIGIGDRKRLRQVRLTLRFDGPVIIETEELARTAPDVIETSSFDSGGFAEYQVSEQ